MLARRPFSDVAYEDLLHYVQDAARVYSGILTGRAKLSENAAQLADVSLRMGLEEIADRFASGKPENRDAARFLSHVYINGIDANDKVETGRPERLLRVLLTAREKPMHDILPLRSDILEVPSRVSEVLAARPVLAKKKSKMKAKALKAG